MPPPDISDSEEETIPPEDLALLKLLKKEVKDKPKGDNPEELKAWMLKYLTNTGGLEAKQEKPTPEEKPPTKKEYVPVKRDPPKISIFSGANLKNETSYDLWRYEVCCLMADKLYEPDTVNYAVRRSLKGDAGRIAMHLGPQASIPEILHKLDSVFGDVEKKEDLLAEFYRARQKDDENVTNWSCRLENIIGKAVAKGQVHKKDVNGMLHSMLWTGLKTSLKDISGHKYDAIKDFDELRVSLRQIEKDHEDREQATRKPQPAKAAASAEETTRDSDMEEVRGLIQQLATRMDRWEGTRGRGRGYRQNTTTYTGYRSQNKRWQDRPKPQPASATPSPTTKEYRCYRCGQLGHIKKGCRTPIDQIKKDLNWKKSVEKDHS